jgi:MoaA/NifB/PqqE/SkfB family radical SAM enzyme
MARPLVGPKQVIIDMTDRCFFRCPTCDKWRVKEVPLEMSLVEWQTALGAIYDWLGPFHLSISGGEPLMRPDVVALIAWANQRQISTNLMTNGWLVDEAMAAALVGAGLGNLTLSLNGLRPETHDASRGVNGSHTRIVAAVDYYQAACRRRGHPGTLSFNVIVAGFNAAELPDLVRWAAQTGIDAVALQPLVHVSSYQPYSQPFQDYRPDWTADDPLWNGDGAALEMALTDLIALKQAGYPILNSVRQLALMQVHFRQPTAVPATNCHVGVNTFLIDPYGKVRLCYTMDAVGDIKETAPEAIWHSPAAAKVRARIRGCGLGCRLLNCNYQPSLSERGAQMLAAWGRSAR